VSAGLVANSVSAEIKSALSFAFVTDVSASFEVDIIPSSISELVKGAGVGVFPMYDN
jgi:hypothetical protein